MASMTGGCGCGRVRYTAEVAEPDAYYCHCRMCQRFSGNVALAFVNLARTEVAWEREPDWFASSPIALRGFCSICGTSLAFHYPDSERIDLTVASFDEAGFFVPTSQFGVEGRLDAWLDTGALPGKRSDEHAPLVARWERVGAGK